MVCVCVCVCSTAGAVKGCGTAWRVCVCAYAHTCMDVCSTAVCRVCVCAYAHTCVDVCSTAGAVEGCGAVLEGVCVCGCVQHSRCGGGL